MIAMILLAIGLGDVRGQAKSKKPKAKKGKTARMMNTCSRCHSDFTDEWKQSGHANSWSNPVFQAEIKDREDGGDACARCHAPASIMKTGLGKIPEARSEDRSYPSTSVDQCSLPLRGGNASGG